MSRDSSPDLYPLDVSVRHNADARTYEARIDGRVAGVIVYEHSAGRTVLTHTIVEAGFRGRGVGTALARSTLDALRAEGARVTNYCGFVRDYIAAHPEYRDLIDGADPGLPLP